MRLAPTAANTLTAALLTILIAGQPLFAANAPIERRPAHLSADARTLHALNRFTFGPTPGQVAEVEKLGLTRWFEQQLHPSSIDDSALDARLAAFPAMALAQGDLMYRYPSNQLLRQMDRTNAPLPNDPVERVIYADQIAFYKEAQARNAAKSAPVTPPAMANTMTNTMPDASTMKPADTPPARDPAVHQEDLYPAAQAAALLSLSPDQRMASILAMPPTELVAFHQSLSRRELNQLTDGLSPDQKEILTAFPNSNRLVTGELLQSRLIRDIYSDRQLEAVMTDFWLNHFNIYAHKNQNEPFLLPSFERDVIRPNALGNFETLLVATAQSPAMLVYLDNWQSIGPDSMAAERAAQRKQRNPNANAPSGINENYARELMELHTLGVKGGYTQADVRQVARVFTGWTIERPNQGAAFQFEPNRHEPGSKTVLGKTIKQAGEAEGLEVLHMLATSPATAHFICQQLAVRFVSDTPPPALVNRMAKSFLSSKGDIKTVLRTLFNSPEFWSPAVVNAKIKTPIEFVVSAARATNAQTANAQPLVRSMATLGMPLYGMQTPNGYSWNAEPWVSTGNLVDRMNFALVLTGNRLPGVRTDLSPALDALPAPDREKQLETLLLGHSVSDHIRATVLQQFQNTDAQQQAEQAFSAKAARPGQRSPSEPAPATSRPKQNSPENHETAMMTGLLIGSPDFQRR